MLKEITLLCKKNITPVACFRRRPWFSCSTACFEQGLSLFMSAVLLYIREITAA